MNYHQPRQINPESDQPDAGKWRYTCMNDGRVWAEGYCAQDCPGHDTREGAYEHQTQYILENRVELRGVHSDTKRLCRAPGCDEWTTLYARVDQFSIFDLCSEHLNIETVTELFGTVGDSYGSW
jgi:hypothetical protein